MNIVQLQVPGDAHALQRSGQMRIAPDVAVQVAFLAAKQRDHVAQFTFFQLDVKGHQGLLRLPFATRHKPAEAARWPVRAGRFCVDAQGPRGVRRSRRPQIHIGVQQVED